MGLYFISYSSKLDALGNHWRVTVYVCVRARVYLILLRDSTRSCSIEAKQHYIACSSEITQLFYTKSTAVVDTITP